MEWPWLPVMPMMRRVLVGGIMVMHALFEMQVGVVVVDDAGDFGS